MLYSLILKSLNVCSASHRNTGCCLPSITLHWQCFALEFPCEQGRLAKWRHQQWREHRE